MTIEVDGQAAKIVNAGEIGLIPADIPHLARNHSPAVATRALVTHSRADKDKPLIVVVKRST